MNNYLLLNNILKIGKPTIISTGLATIDEVKNLYTFIDKNFKNYFGIIMDDIMAGFYTMIAIYILSIYF